MIREMIDITQRQDQPEQFIVKLDRHTGLVELTRAEKLGLEWYTSPDEGTALPLKHVPQLIEILEKLVKIQAAGV